MSEQPVFIAGHYPDPKSEKEDNARRVAIAFHAKDIKHAQAKATFIFIEEYPGSQDAAYKTLVCEASDDVPCPQLDKWDEEFLYNHDWPEDVGHPVARASEEPELVEFDKLSATMKIAVLVKYMTTEITKDQLPAALELLQDEASTFPGHIVEAVSKMPPIVSMYPERIMEAIAYVVEKCPTNKKWPEIKAQLATWLKEHEKERKEATGESDREEVITTSSSTAYNGRTYEHNYRTLNKEIAYALWSGDVDPAKTDPSISRWADGIIKDDREDWKRWSACIVTRENILTFDRPTIFGLVRNAPKPDIYKFPGELNAYIADYLAKHGVIEGGDNEKEQEPQNVPDALADAQTTSGSVDAQHPDNEPEEAPEEVVTERQGPFYYRTAAGDKIGRANKLPKLQEVVAQGCVEISQEEYQARKTGTYQAPQETTEKPEAQPEVNKIADGVFSIDNLMGEQPKVKAEAEPTAPSNEVEKTEKTEVKDEQLPMESEHFAIWSQVSRTDPKYTKPVSVGGYSFTSISGQYMFMLATKTFGPVGTGWGYEITGDEMLPGKPMMEIVKSAEGKDSYRILRDADGSLITELNHALRIEFWYRDKNGSRHTFEAWGHTPYMTSGAGGKITTDSEVKKKSLTDAIKKALSMLGFCADIFLGQFDDPAYLNELKTESSLSEAAGKVIDKTLQRKEFDEQFSLVADTMAKATSVNEVEKISAKLIRELGIQQKSASATGNKDFAEYLSGRLRRLSQIKDERIKTLTEQEQSA